MKAKTITATKLRADCFRLLDEVAQGQVEFVITRRGKPVARLVAPAPTSRKRNLAGRIVGDLLGFSEPEWIAHDRPPVRARARITGDLLAPLSVPTRS